jgi:uncharacterized protein (TIGR02145 family)
MAGKALKSESGWNNYGNGTDTYGFSALPGGGWHSNGGFTEVGIYGYWWMAKEDGSGYAYERYMSYNGGSVYQYRRVGKSDGKSVRCVGD